MTRTRWVLIGVVAALAIAQAASSASGAGILFQATFRQTGTGATDRSAMSKMRDTVSIKDFGADSTGVADSSSAFTNAIAALGATGGLVWVPSGTYRANFSITTSNIEIRGSGRRSTILKPATNAAIITINSTAGTVQGFTGYDLGFDATTTGFTSPAILITGSNVNDHHEFVRFFMNGLTKSITVTGRCIWCRFVGGEINNDLSNGVDVTGAFPFNAIDFDAVLVNGSAGNGFEFNYTGADTFKGISLKNCTSQLNVIGLHATNVDSLHVYGGSYFESNSSADIKIEGTWAQAFVIEGSQIWGPGTNIYNHATLTDGVIWGNRLNNAATATLDINTSHALSSILIGPNRDGGTHTFSGGKVTLFDVQTGNIVAGATSFTPPAATAGQGFRNASTRNIVRNSSVAPVDCGGAGISATVTQVLDGAVFTCATAQTLTLPTAQGASGIIQGLPGTPAVGDVFEIFVVSTAAANFTTAAGTGGTLTGNAVVNNGSKLWRCRVTAVTAASETYTCY